MLVEVTLAAVELVLRGAIRRADPTDILDFHARVLATMWSIRLVFMLNRDGSTFCQTPRGVLSQGPQS